MLLSPIVELAIRGKLPEQKKRLKFPAPSIFVYFDSLNQRIMQFGQLENPGLVDFALPEDHPDTVKVLARQKPRKVFQVWVGCAKWNRKDLKGFYPRGTPDELRYYASQFNSIELNATFYRAPDAGQVDTWKGKTPAGFRFYP